MITHSFEWSPLSTPPAVAAPGSIQVNTNGRGAPVWILPRALPRQGVPAGGGFRVTPRPPKLMMDPRDATTWQRPYRWT